MWFLKSGVEWLNKDRSRGTPKNREASFIRFELAADLDWSSNNPKRSEMQVGLASLDGSWAVGWWQDGEVPRSGVGRGTRGASLTTETRAADSPREGRGNKC